MPPRPRTSRISYFPKVAPAFIGESTGSSIVAKPATHAGQRPPNCSTTCAGKDWLQPTQRMVVFIPVRGRPAGRPLRLLAKCVQKLGDFLGGVPVDGVADSFDDESAQPEPRAPEEVG